MSAKSPFWPTVSMLTCYLHTGNQAKQADEQVTNCKFGQVSTVFSSPNILNHIFFQPEQPSKPQRLVKTEDGEYKPSKRVRGGKFEQPDYYDMSVSYNSLCVCVTA